MHVILRELHGIIAVNLLSAKPKKSVGVSAEIGVTETTGEL